MVPNPPPSDWGLATPFPLAPATQAPPAAGPPPAAEVVLVVDDDRVVREVVSRLLRREGLAVREAAGGEEALSACRDRACPIGLVLLDVVMPGLDGPRTLERLRAIDPRVRCCFLTGGAGPYSAEDLLALGALRVFTKPVRSFPALAAELRSLIASPREG